MGNCCSNLSLAEDEDVVRKKLLKSPLVGKVFTRNDDKFGKQSIHFNDQGGCYVSYEAGGYRKKKDG